MCRFASTFGDLENRTTVLIRLAKQLRSHRPRSTAGGGTSSTTATAGGGNGGSGTTNNSNSSGEGGAGGLNAEGVDISGLDEEEGEAEGESPGGGGSSTKVSGLPGNLVKSWWKARSPYEGAAGFNLMRQEMLIKTNAQQARLVGRVLGE